jgi:hypothetical protein
VAIRLEDLLASFRRHLRAAAKAPRTIELYSQSVQYFSRWLVDRGREPVLDELTRHAIAAWLAELAETCEPSTISTRLRGMRRFCRWLVTEGELEKAPVMPLHGLWSPARKPRRRMTWTTTVDPWSTVDSRTRGRRGAEDRAPRRQRRQRARMVAKASLRAVVGSPGAVAVRQATN